MAEKSTKQDEAKTESDKTLYHFPDIDGQAVSVEASSQDEAEKLARKKVKSDEEGSE